jgi:excisionase family DNA binding protein
VNELAELVKLNPQTVREKIDRGELRAVRAGQRVRIRQAELDRLIAVVETAPVERVRNHSRD